MFILLHGPGPLWRANTPFTEQPDVASHVKYMRKYFDQGRIPMGGPFADDSGGMMLLEAGDLSEATKIAHADPTVIAGLAHGSSPSLARCL
jgi:uncharacterized protein